MPVFERLRELTGHEVVERYGMSETLITVATRADGVRQAGWVGVPVAGVETRLRDEAGDPVPHDGESVGRLEVRGATLFDGYLHRPEATAEAWTDGRLVPHRRRGGGGARRPAPDRRAGSRWT